MNLGELRDHPDFTKLIIELENLIALMKDRVLVSSKEDSIEEIRFKIGGVESLSLFKQKLLRK